MRVLGDVQLTVAGQLIVAAIEKLASEPNTELTDGRVYYNTTSHKLFVYRAPSWTEITSGQFVDAIGDFTDVNFTTLSEGDTLVYSDGEYINKQIQHLYSYSGTGTTVHTITHNLGQQYVNVEVYDTSVTPAQLIIPESIEITSNNSCKVTLNEDIHCNVFVFGIGGDVVQMTTLPSSTGTAYSGGLQITRGEGYTQFYAPSVNGRIRFGAPVSTTRAGFEYSVHSLGTLNTLYVGIATGNTDMSNASTWFTGLTKYAFATWSVTGSFGLAYKKGNDSGNLTSTQVPYNRRNGILYRAPEDSVRLYYNYPENLTSNGNIDYGIGVSFAPDVFYVVMSIPVGACVRVYDQLIGTGETSYPKWDM